MLLPVTSTDTAKTSGSVFTGRRASSSPWSTIAFPSGEGTAQNPRLFPQDQIRMRLRISFGEPATQPLNLRIFDHRGTRSDAHSADDAGNTLDLPERQFRTAGKNVTGEQGYVHFRTRSITPFSHAPDERKVTLDITALQ